MLLCYEHFPMKTIEKRTVLLALMLIAGVMLSAMTVTAEAYPSSITVSWDAVGKAASYKLYVDGELAGTFDSSELGYSMTKLPPDTAYSFRVSAYGSTGKPLGSAETTASTTNWDGTYLWVNQTDKDNDGKVRELRMRIKGVDSHEGFYFEIYSYDSKGAEYRICPLEGADDWISYKSSSPTAVAYRNNAECFNTSSIKPGKFKVEKLVIDYDSTSAYIQTSAVGMKLTTVTDYRFFVEDGVRKVSFHTHSDSSLVSRYLFNNPNPGEGPEFILVEI